MLNEEKVRLMTELAIFEENAGKKDISINGYFRGDYISFQVLKSAIYATIGFAVAFAMYILYDLEDFLANLYKLDIIAFSRDVCTKYFAVLAVYVLISYFVYAFRYTRAKKHLKRYAVNLRRLREIYSHDRRVD